MDRRAFLLAAGGAAVIAHVPACLAKEQPVGLTLDALKRCVAILSERHVEGPYVVYVPKDLVLAMKEEAARYGGTRIDVIRMDRVGYTE